MAADDNARNGQGGKLCCRSRVCQQCDALVGKRSKEAGVVVALCATGKHDISCSLHQQPKTLSATLAWRGVAGQ